MAELGGWVNFGRKPTMVPSPRLAQGADGILEQQLHSLRLETPQVHIRAIRGGVLIEERWLPIRFPQPRTSFALHLLVCKGLRYRLCDLLRFGDQRFDAGVPVNLHRTRKVGNGIGLKSHAAHPVLLALHQGGAGAAERIKHGVARLDAESIQVVLHQVRREGQDESIPMMHGAVFRPQLVFAAGCRGGNGGIGLGPKHGVSAVLGWLGGL